MRLSHSNPIRCRGREACRAETRSQGIATGGSTPAVAQKRRAPCRAETRSHGIATLEGSPQAFAGRKCILAEPRPVLRGLRRRPLGQGSETCVKALQSRDPFSGDCDLTQVPPGTSYRLHPLQSRDPFSGDCDDPHSSSSSGSSSSSLQSRDPFSGDCDLPRGEKHRRPCWPPACRAETRSQGIATRAPAMAAMRGIPMDLQSRDPFSGDCDSE